ncbi:MAG: flavin reductase family protein [Clostridia bacterium]|nr:flavin reductase family protein [Clostridia bacterium]
MMKSLAERFEAAMRQLPRGAFLTTEGRFNPMTIGWCQLGLIWGKPICTVFVRKSRFSYALMEASPSFCVSVPEAGGMAEALALCGSVSGHDGDKAARAGLAPVRVLEHAAPGVAGCADYFVCRRLFSADSALERMDPELRARYYGANQALPDGDPHVIYFGELLNP